MPSYITDLAHLTLRNPYGEHSPYRHSKPRAAGPLFTPHAGQWEWDSTDQNTITSSCQARKVISLYSVVRDFILDIPKSVDFLTIFYSKKMVPTVYCLLNRAKKNRKDKDKMQEKTQRH